MKYSALEVVLAISRVGIALSLDIPVQQRSPGFTNDVIIQMFQWNWDSVAAECTNFIGPAGYGYVQVSPPQEHIQGSQWWTDYQPVSYILTSKRGNRSQFQNMIQTCHTAGVKVITGYVSNVFLSVDLIYIGAQLDTLWNHMAGISGGTGVAGSSQFNYPGIYQSNNFHYCGTPNNAIVSYANATQIWTCELDNLADLATDTTYVQGKLAAYGNDLLSLGVDGYRLDAAKHMGPNNISAILSQLTSKPYITQEVIYGAGDAVQPSMYVQNGDVMEFRFASTVETYFQSSGIGNLPSTITDGGWTPSNSANVFVADHDTERSGGSLNYASPSNTYTLAHVFMLAYPYGTPTVLSSYSFTTSDQGAPNGSEAQPLSNLHLSDLSNSDAGTCTATAGSNGWLCQHRWPAIAGMTGFRNKVGSAALTNLVSGTSQQVAFGRGSLGFVAMNNEDSTWSSAFTTSLPAGAYCDVASGSKSSGGSCSGAAYIVSGGQVTLNIPSRSAIGLHTGQTSSSTLAVTFDCTATTNFGENIFITGSISQLSSWGTSNAIPLSASSYPKWSVTVAIPASTSFQYKYIRIVNGTVTWEYNPNRTLTTPANGSVTQNDVWNGPAP